MLRVRRGLGSSASFASICRPYVRNPRQFTPFRLFATGTNLDDASEPSTDPKSHTENIPKPLHSTSDVLQGHVNRTLSNETQEVKKQDEAATKSSASDDTNFNEALDVVRRVYGVDKKQRKKKKKKPKPQSQSQSQSQAGGSNNAQAIEESNTPEIDSSTGTTQAAVWTSLREKLQQNIPVGSSNTFQSTHEDSAAFVSDQDASILSSSLSTGQHAERAEPQPFGGSAIEETEFVKAGHKGKHRPEVKKFVPRDMLLKPVEKQRTKNVPRLAYHLDKVLFNSGPYQLQDTRTQVYNFDPYLGTIMPVKEFDFNALKEYITSSKDETLTKLSAQYNKKYCGSTSSMTSMLAHFHFLLSAWRKPNFGHLSRSFDVEFESFTVLTRAPVAAFARYKDGVYAIDADKEFDSASILSMLGKSMEKLLTLPKEQFEKYRRSRSHELSEEEKNADEAFHYTTLGDFMMRSQLDARDPRLPGTGVFDLKTRAVVTIRMDVGDYEKGVGYEIDSRFGQWNSFEREYYDMIRAAFLKYSLQVRMGRMDGIFVAFHNTERIFGFQYISLEEMDHAIHGTMNRQVGDEEFKASIGLLNELLDRASKRFPEQSLRLHVETRPLDPAVMYFVAEPVSDEEMLETQEKGKAAVEQLEKQILGISRASGKNEDFDGSEEIASLEEEEEIIKGVRKPTSLDSPQRQKSWDDMMAKVDEIVENDAAGLANVREAIEQALEQSGLLAGKSEDKRHAYLNELVEALTEDLKDGKEGAIDSGDALNTSAADDLQEVAQSSLEGSEGSVQVGSSLETETLLAQLDEASQGESFAAGLESEAIKSDEETATEDAVEESAMPSSDVVSQDASLKDLILKVAEGVENTTNSLGTFEQVLSQLVRDQKQLSNEVDEENSAGVDNNSTTDDSLLEEAAKSDQKKPKKSEREVLGMYITIRNKVDDQIVDRVEHQSLGELPEWSVEYTITEFPQDKARRILGQMRGRRRKLMDLSPSARTKTWYTLWNGELQKRTRAGRRARRALAWKEEKRGTKVAWTSKVMNHPNKNAFKASPTRKATLKKKAVSKKTKPLEKDSPEKESSEKHESTDVKKD